VRTLTAVTKIKLNGQAPPREDDFAHSWKGMVIEMSELQTSNLNELEERLLAEVSRDALWEHAKTLAQWERISGTAGERAAVEYLKRCLEDCGVRTTVYEFESLLGWPEDAELKVGNRSFEVITHSFAPSTPTEGVGAEVVYAGSGEQSEFAEADAEGKIAIVEGLASSTRVLRGQRAGVAGLIFVNEDRLHDMCVSPVWGTPTTRTASLLPTIPVVSVRRTEGEELKAIASEGRLRALIRSKTFWGWRPTQLLVGELTGAVDADQFVLFSGHHCSWYYGAMDNGTANATMLEVARILSRHPTELRRTVRLAFWPGHTQGRYSGSTWYCDNFWEDLHDNCVLHVNVDSTGARGANIYKSLCMPETHDFAVAAIRDATGYDPEPERQSRAGDQSFWGCGVPSVYMDISQVPLEMAARAMVASGLFTAADQPARHVPSGLPWWWHTPDDTIDKIDLDVLERDTKIYVLATLRAASAALLPFRYEPAARQIRETIARYAEAAAGSIDLSTTVMRAKEVEGQAAEVDALLAQVRSLSLDDERVSTINRSLMAMDRELVLVNFTSEGPFDQDLAVPIPAVPLLEPARRLMDLDPASDEAHFLGAELTRNRNKVSHHLRLAIKAGEQAAEALRHARQGAPTTVSDQA
jgi:Iap family predicted aminopeptidase